MSDSTWRCWQFLTGKLEKSPCLKSSPIILQSNSFSHCCVHISQLWWEQSNSSQTKKHRIVLKWKCLVLGLPRVGAKSSEWRKDPAWWCFNPELESPKGRKWQFQTDGIFPSFRWFLRFKMVQWSGEMILYDFKLKNHWSLILPGISKSRVPLDMLIWWLSPLKKIRVHQLGLWHSQWNLKIKFLFQTTNQL